MNGTAKRLALAAASVAVAAVLPWLVLRGTRVDRESADRSVARRLALWNAHYAEPSGVPVSTLRTRADHVGTGLVAGFQAFRARWSLEPRKVAAPSDGSELAGLAFKETLIRFRERNAERLSRVAVSGAFVGAAFADLRPEVLDEYLVQAAATEALLNVIDGLPLDRPSARVSSARVRRTRIADLIDPSSVVRATIRLECRTSAAGLDALLARVAEDSSPFVTERLEVENAFESVTERRHSELALRLDLAAIRIELLERPRWTDQRPPWVREVEDL